VIEKHRRIVGQDLHDRKKYVGDDTGDARGNRGWYGLV
jgi:hypothetical protein